MIHPLVVNGMNALCRSKNQNILIPRGRCRIGWGLTCNPRRLRDWAFGKYPANIMRAHLILPPFPFLRKEKILPLNLAYLAAIVPPAVELQVLDANLHAMSPSAFAKTVGELDSDLLLFTAHTYQTPFVFQAAAAAKQTHPGTLTVIGGPHVTVLPEETLRRGAALDVAVIGEGEQTLQELIAAKKNGEPYEAIAGLLFRRDGELIRTARRDFIQDLDALPLPAWRHFEVRRYSAFYPLRGTSIPIITSRGCPFSCRFCVRAQGHRVRNRGLEVVKAELNRGLAEGHHTFDFVDETFTLDRRRALNLCEYILGLPPEQSIEWVAQTRVDCVDGEMVSLMARAGCRAINFGIESGDQTVLDSLGKDITVAQIVRAVELCRHAKIKMLANVILGAPLETPATLRATRKLILSLQPDRLAANQLVAFPGTEMYELAQRGEYGMHLIHDDWGRMHPQMKTNLRVPGVTQRRISWAHFLLYFRFYVLRPNRETLRTILTPTFARQYFVGLLATLFSRRTDRTGG